MNASDRQYLSRFALDPAIDDGLEELDGSNFSDDIEKAPFDLENILDPIDLTPEDRFPIEN
jgi:hypothetical protein